MKYYQMVSLNILLTLQRIFQIYSHSRKMLRDHTFEFQNKQTVSNLYLQDIHLVYRQYRRVHKIILRNMKITIIFHHPCKEYTSGNSPLSKVSKSFSSNALEISIDLSPLKLKKMTESPVFTVNRLFIFLYDKGRKNLINASIFFSQIFHSFINRLKL